MRRFVSLRCYHFHGPVATALVAVALVLPNGSAAIAQARPAAVKLRIGGHDVSLKPPAVYNGSELYLPLVSLRELDLSYTLTARQETAIIRFADGATSEYALARPTGDPMVPFSAIRGTLKMDFVVQHGVCDLFRQGEPHGWPTPPAQAPVRPQPAAASVRRATSARTPDTPPDGPGVQHTESVDADPQAAPSGSVARTVDRTAPQATVHGMDLSDRGGRHAGQQGGIPLPRVDNVTFQAAGADGARIIVHAAGRVQASIVELRDASKLAVDIPCSTIGTDQHDWEIEHPFVSAIHLVDGVNPGSTRLLVDLARLTRYKLSEEHADGGTTITVELGLPRGSGKGMGELVVVIDPGHGGSSGTNPTGCSGTWNGQYLAEKNLTLAIALKVRKHLEDAGVTVLMTRTRDVSLTLPERPAMAIRNHADLFVSIHIDDTDGGANSASGTTAYYPSGDSSSYALAHSIVQHIAQVSGLPNRRARGDHERFHGTGMAVLHTGGIPATLVEVGYLNNERDRARLIDPEFQDSVATAIVDGIASYVQANLPDRQSAALN